MSYLTVVCVSRMMHTGEGGSSLTIKKSIYKFISNDIQFLEMDIIKYRA